MSEELKRVLRSRQYVLLIGNGINRYFGGGNWIDLLKKVIRRNLGDSSYLESAIGQDGITNTEIQNIIPIEFNRKTGLQIQSKDLLQSVIQNIDRINYDSAPILDRCKNDGCQIITTNFDFNIENYLWRESQYKLIRPTSTRYVTSNYYPWDISFGFQAIKQKFGICTEASINGRASFYP